MLHLLTYLFQMKIIMSLFNSKMVISELRILIQAIFIPEAVAEVLTIMKDRLPENIALLLM